MATAVRDKGIEDIFTEQQRKMATVRRDVMGVFTKYERIVKDQLGGVTRKANESYEDEKHNQISKDSLQKELEAAVKEMEGIKTKVEGCLEPLQPKDSKSSQDSSSKGKEGGKTEQDPDWVDTDKKLENFLEEAAKDDKGKDFDQLDGRLKNCLLCLPIFPVGAVIRKRVLIYWWIGEGFITPKGDEAADQVGEEVFNDLVEREFIQPVYNKRSGNVLKCKVHPWIHWMLITKSRETNFFVLDDKGMPSPSPSETHRACLISDDGRHPPEPTPNPQDPSLRSLFNVNVRYLKFTAESFLKMKSIVALQLGRWQGSSEVHIEVEQPEVLEKLRQLVQLRYLSLRGISVIETLPYAIKELQNLKILDVRGCQNLKKLTKGITSLKRLTHLDVSECYMLESMPKGLGSMSELEMLKGFVVGSSKTGRIVDLVKLPKIKKLSIIISSQARINGDLHELKKMKALLSLTITWSILHLTTDEERCRKLLKIEGFTSLAA